ncbi:MAG: hypothetical protein PHS83_06775, partial [Clostridia bacterium]|nr:hypothetical protein [Clostridia bacterium]
LRSAKTPPNIRIILPMPPNSPSIMNTYYIVNPSICKWNLQQQLFKKHQGQFETGFSLVSNCP